MGTFQTHHASDTSSTAQQDTQKPRRLDKWAIWGGVIFAFAFTTLIYLTAPALQVFPHLPDQGASWYYWKLAEPTTLSHLTAWVFYLAHQITLWGLIWYAQTHVKKYTGGLHRVNVIALAANAYFIGLHFVQTHIWYDGLAQDVSIFSSQGSVIVMLVWILLMENKRRGLFFGKKVPISQRITQFARKYHGYFFAWAIIYTFWYHPMEATNGHLVGFFYTFLLLLQGSLFLTRIHVNKFWTFVQEVIVLAHGTIVAIVQGNSLWPMFFFGFGGILIITQMHGLGLKNWIKWLLIGIYVALAVWVYSQQGISKIWQLAAIPAIDYLAVGVLALLIAIGLWVYDRLRGTRPDEISGAAA
ncbi:MAG: hypothetical protein ABI690_21810 [Chloroflexota bacterium]